jgi:formylglycine-generating enzyme required for sulfatase activity
MAENETPPVTLFYSYSHADEALRNELADHLVPLERAGLIEVWHDREMLPGDTVDDEIARKLQAVDIVLALISPSFIKSSYCYDIEFKNAIERHRRGEARVVPVVLRPCQWQLTPLKDLLALPTDGKAVTTWPNRDDAFNDVARGLARLAQTMQRTVVGPSPAVPQGPAPTRRREPQPPPAAPVVQIGADPRRLPDLAVFKDVDAPWCPEMVVIPAGEFLMGSPEDEEGHETEEGPQHRVIIGYRFALGRYAVTFEEFDHFCDETKQYKPHDQYWGRDRRPVVNVSWQDSIAYGEWLSRRMGKPYGLPSEAEWEYACRAGTTTPFSFGKTISSRDANYNGTYTYGLGPAGVYRERSREVGRFPANPFGLHEMHGNVWEWVEDIWHDAYRGAPANGTEWTDGKSKESTHVRVVRGGAWNTQPRYLRSAYRLRYPPDHAAATLGFRVARTLR